MIFTITESTKLSELHQENTLYHHGIKGMKWGVRRFQKKNGELTSAGKKRYRQNDQTKQASINKSHPKEKRYDKLYSKYIAEGYSELKAHRLAKGQVATERVLIGIGAVAAATAIGYAAYKFQDNRLDRFISPGQKMQTVHKESVGDRLKSGNPFYATYTKADNKIYASKVFSHFSKDSTVTQFYTNDGIKVASRNTGRKILDDLIKSNKDIRDYVDILPIKDKTNSKKRYDIFNKCLVLRTDKSKPNAFDHDRIHDIFYNELRKRGYGAVIDVNDAKLEGFTFKPVIVFDKQAKRVISSTKATDVQLGTKRFLEAAKLSRRRKTLNMPLSNPMIASFAAIGSTSTVMTSIKANSFIKQYRRKHPNTNLTDFQITNIYLQENRKR